MDSRIFRRNTRKGGSCMRGGVTPTLQNLEARLQQEETILAKYKRNRNTNSITNKTYQRSLRYGNRNKYLKTKRNERNKLNSNILSKQTFVNALKKRVSNERLKAEQEASRLKAEQEASRLKAEQEAAKAKVNANAAAAKAKANANAAAAKAMQEEANAKAAANAAAKAAENRATGNAAASSFFSNLGNMASGLLKQKEENNAKSKATTVNAARKELANKITEATQMITTLQRAVSNAQGVVTKTGGNRRTRRK